MTSFYPRPGPIPLLRGDVLERLEVRRRRADVRHELRVVQHPPRLDHRGPDLLVVLPDEHVPRRIRKRRQFLNLLQRRAASSSGRSREGRGWLAYNRFGYAVDRREGGAPELFLFDDAPGAGAPQAHGDDGVPPVFDQPVASGATAPAVADEDADEDEDGLLLVDDVGFPGVAAAAKAFYDVNGARYRVILCFAQLALVKEAAAGGDSEDWRLRRGFGPGIVVNRRRALATVAPTALPEGNLD